MNPFRTHHLQEYFSSSAEVDEPYRRHPVVQQGEQIEQSEEETSEIRKNLILFGKCFIVVLVIVILILISYFLYHHFQ
ncbi:hypothetical protein WA026_016584 [Henosepilachna vigintioctopunctata]|uniref:Uncharacterized protein n=1 Tax=Henosepilachna vigintioctopunctata TaxID=420089 RepID=A0AAW1V9F1_9CUCU